MAAKAHCAANPIVPPDRHKKHHAAVLGEAEQGAYMVTQRKPRPEWFHYALATGVSVFVALMIAGLGTFVGH